MVNAQTWLDNTIPKDQRNNIKELHILPDTLLTNPRYNREINTFFLPLDTLTGDLDLSDFTELKDLDIEKQAITYLNLLGCQKLNSIRVENNFLEAIVWPERLLGSQQATKVLPQLKFISLVNNNFRIWNISYFANFPNLETLFLGTNDRARIQQGKYNRWTGSLSHISNLVKLKELDINATDINDGLIDLPTNELIHFTFGSCGRAEAGVNKLMQDLDNSGFVVLLSGETMEDWARIGFEDYDHNSEKIDIIIDIIREWKQRIRLQETQQLQSQTQIGNW